MKNIIKSPIIKIIAIIFGYIAALNSVQMLSRAFSYYIGREISQWLRLDISASASIFILCAALLFVSVYMSKGGKPPAWRKLDLPLLIVLTVCAVSLFLLNTRDAYFRFMSIQVWLILMSAISYGLFMALLAETSARIRDKELNAYWIRFLSLYPPFKRLAGLLIILLMSAHAVYFLIILPVAALRMRYFNVLILLLMALTYATLTYLCKFILTLSDEYDRANEDKIRAERFKTELITNISHDIKTPLTAIISYVGLLKSAPADNADYSNYVDILDKKAARLKTLIDDLMEASKVGAGSVDVDLRQLDFNEIVGQVAGEYDDQFSERGLTLVLRQPDTPAAVRADSGHLWRVLENLFDNAVKYALPGTRVFAEITLRGGSLAFTMRNTSQNPIDMLGDSLVEQFIRGDRSRHTEGSGLGLYIAKNLVELMGGRFEIRVAGDLFEAELQFGII